MSNRVSQVTEDVLLESDATVDLRVSQTTEDILLECDTEIFLRTSQVTLDVLFVPDINTGEILRSKWVY